jgi:hypothetical protein
MSNQPLFDLDTAHKWFGVEYNTVFSRFWKNLTGVMKKLKK